MDRMAVGVCLLALQATLLPAQTRGGLTLGDAARLAATQSANAEAARYRAGAAASRVREQRAELLPNLSGWVSIGARTFNSAGFGLAFPDPVTGGDLFSPDGEVLGPVRTWDLRGAARWSLVDLAAIARLRAAGAVAAAARSEATSVSEQAADLAALAYLRAVRADALLAAREEDSALAGELVHIAQRQWLVGMATALDETRAEARLAATRADLARARAERDRAGLDLQRTLGLPVGPPMTLAESLLTMATDGEVPSEAAATERALRSRVDLHALEAQMMAAERQLSAIKAERIPALVAFADLGRTGTGAPHLLHTYSWGIQLSIPVFDGARRGGRMAEQRYAVQEFEVRRRDLVQQVLLDVRGALLDISAAREQIAASEERLDLAEQELAQARRRFTNGVAGNADVVTALIGVNAARTEVVNAHAAFHLVRVALARAQGTVMDLPLGGKERENDE